MEKIEIQNKEKLVRFFGKGVDEASLFTRLGFAGKKEFCGKIKGETLLLYRRKLGILSLFALTLRGKLVSEGGKTYLLCRFSRSVPLSIFWSLWCALLLAAGFSIVGSDPLFSLWFFIPGVLFALPLFLFSKKEKARLRTFFESKAPNLQKTSENKE